MFGVGGVEDEGPESCESGEERKRRREPGGRELREPFKGLRQRSDYGSWSRDPKRPGADEATIRFQVGVRATSAGASDRDGRRLTGSTGSLAGAVEANEWIASQKLRERAAVSVASPGCSLAW